MRAHFSIQPVSRAISNRPISKCGSAISTANRPPISWFRRALSGHEEYRPEMHLHLTRAVICETAGETAMDQSAVLLASEPYQAGRLEPPAELLRAFLAAVPFDAPANHLLGGIYYRQGKYGPARDHLARACSTPGATAEMFNNYGAALKALGDMSGAVA